MKVLLPVLYTQHILLGPEPPNILSTLSWKPFCLDSKGEGVWLPNEMIEFEVDEEDGQAFESWLCEQMF